MCVSEAKLDLVLQVKHLDLVLKMKTSEVKRS